MNIVLTVVSVVVVLVLSIPFWVAMARAKKRGEE